MDDGHEIESLDSRYFNQPRHANIDNAFSDANNFRYDTNHLSNGEDLSSTSSGSTSSIPVITDRGESSRLAAIFLLVNSALGAGLLNFPQAFDQAGGITVALLVQLVLIACVCLGLLILSHTSWLVHASTLHDTMAGTCGLKGSLLCSLLIALYCFGTCVTFLIIIGDQFDRVFMTLVGVNFCHTWFMNRHFTIVASTLVFILPLCFSRKIDFLKYASSLGVLAVIYLVGLVVMQYYSGNFTPGPIKTEPDHWTDIFKVVPVICFGYQCHVSIITTYTCMQDRRISSLTVVILVTVAVCAAAYTLTGVYGYLTFGGDVEADVLVNYSKANVAVLVGIAAIAVKTVTAYPIMLFCGREAVNNVWQKLSRDWDPCSEKLRRYVVSSVWLTLTLLVAVISPGIGVVIDALGILAAVFIFVFPGLCLLQTCLQTDNGLLKGRTRFYVAVAILFAALGAFIMGVVLVQTIERIYVLSEPPTAALLQCT